jgi:dTDP-4-amino-4,6-dideoxygalactose transaminase
VSERAARQWRAFLSGYRRLHVYTVDPGAHAMARELVPIIREDGRLVSWFADGWSAAHAVTCRPSSELPQALLPGDGLILGSQTNYSRTQAVIRQAATSEAKSIFIFDHWKNYGEHFAGGALADAIVVPDDVARTALMAALGEAAARRVQVLPHLALAAAVERIAKRPLCPEAGLIAVLLDPTEAADGLGYDWRNMLAAMAECAAQRNRLHDHVRVLVRPHPRQDVAMVSDGLCEFAWRGIPAATDTGDVEMLIARASEIWGMTTTALNVALAAGKPVKSFQIGRNAAGAKASNPHIEPFTLTSVGSASQLDRSRPVNETLAINGGSPAVERPLKGFNGIGAHEREAVMSFLSRATPLSGFHGSARPTFFGGPEVRAFEDAWRERFAVEHVISVNSATSGLIAAMGAIGIGPGDEVITSPYTMTATAIAPLIYGGIPVFADIEPDYFCLDPMAVERAITPRTRAILAVNLFGHPAELSALRRLADAKGLYLVEDSAQAVLAEEGSRLAGTVGHIGIFSLNIHKHIQTGEGGVCITADADLARRLQLIRNHGENVVDWLQVKDLTNIVGFNFRLTELSAAVGRAQLERLDQLVARVESIARRLTEGTSDLPGFSPPAVRRDCRHVYFMWSAKVDPTRLGASRATFSKALEAEGVPNAQGYVKPIYSLPMFQQRIAIGKHGFPFNLGDRTYLDGLCPVTEAMHRTNLIQFQPVSWDVEDDQVDMMIEAIHKVHRHADLLHDEG